MKDLREADLVGALRKESPAAVPMAREAALLGLRPVEWILAGYLVLTTLVLALRSGYVHKWPLLLATRVILGILLGLSASGRIPRQLQWVRDWYPVLIAPLFYSEIALLNRAFTAGYFDLSVSQWETRIFGGQPSIELRDKWPATLLSEYLHLAYFSYYFLVPAVAALLYFQGKRQEFQVFMGTVSSVFFACLLIYVVFPVAGPFYIYAPPAPHSMGAIMPPLVHWVLRHGSSVGTAFPSSHVAVAVTVLLLARNYGRTAFLCLLALVPGLAVGAVYGGFHYAVDTVAGALLALIVWRIVPGWIAPRTALPESSSA